MSITDALLAESKVHQLNMSFTVQQNIVQLQIAINDIVLMQKEQGNCNFHRIETS